MNKIQKFEDLNVWKESVKLSVKIYKSLKNCKDFGLRDQLQRSAVSIPSNIAEGFDRKGNKEFIQFLYIAKGSCSELRTQLYIAVEVGIILAAKAQKANIKQVVFDRGAYRFHGRLKALADSAREGGLDF